MRYAASKAFKAAAKSGGDKRGFKLFEKAFESRMPLSKLKGTSASNLKDVSTRTPKLKEIYRK